MSTHTNSRLPTHTVTAALAAAVAAVISPTLQSVSADRDVQAIQLIAPDAPQNRITLREGSALTVPAGKIFVVEGLGIAEWSSLGIASADPGVRTTLTVNGLVIASAAHIQASGAAGKFMTELTIIELPGKPTFSSGDVVSVESIIANGSTGWADPIGTAFGYLADI